MSPAPAVYNLALVVTCVICYYNSLKCGLVFDDISAIRENKDLRPHTPIYNLFVNDFWGTPIHKEQSHKSYRPLCVITFRWNYFLHQLEPMGYHLVNVLLHVTVCLIYFRMCRLFLPLTSSFVSVILFAVHPIHTEAVTGVVGRAESLSSIFFLAAILSYTKCTGRRKRTVWRHLLCSVVFLSVAMLCKEQGITAVGIILVYEVFVVQRMRLGDIWQHKIFIRKVVPNWITYVATRVGFLICVTVTLLILRVHIMGAKLPAFTRFDNPAASSPFPIRHLTYSYLWSLNAWLLVFPCTLCCDWTMGTVPLIKSVNDSRNLTTLTLGVTLFMLGIAALRNPDKHKTGTIITSISMIIVPFLPASNIFYPVGFVIAERVLYIPSMGFCMLIAQGWERIETNRSFSRIAWAGMAVLLISHGCKTIHRNNEWESEYSIFMAGLKVNQNNAKLFNNVGHTLEEQGKFHEALWYFQKAVSVQSDDIGALMNVGRTLNKLDKFNEAEEAYVKAKSLLPKAKPGESYQARIAPNHLNVFLNLANLIARNDTRLEEADRLYRQVISMREDYIQAYINRGDILLKMNRTKEAQDVYERALLYDNLNPDIYYNLGVVILEQGKALEALSYFDKALSFTPDHQQALLSSAILIQEMGYPYLRQVATDRLLKLLSISSGNERVYFNLGMLAMDNHDLISAENWFRKAVELKEDFRSALFNLALLLSDDHRPLEAAAFLNQLVKHHPEHSKGLILLGDIYFNIKDLDAAEECYKRILSLEPENIQGLHNMCVVYVERGELVRAEQCLSHVQQLAPHKEYVTRHLKIIRTKLVQDKKEERLTSEYIESNGVKLFETILNTEDSTKPVS